MAYSLLPRVAARAFAADGTPALNLIGTQLGFYSRSVDGPRSARLWAADLFTNPKFPAVDHVVITIDDVDSDTLRKPQQAPAARAKATKPECRYTLGRKLTARKAPAGLTAYAVVGSGLYQVAVFRGETLIGLVERDRDGYTAHNAKGRRAARMAVRTLAQAMELVA